MNDARWVLLVLSLVLFLLDAVRLPSGPVNFTAAGLACWVATLIPGLFAS